MVSSGSGIGHGTVIVPTQQFMTNRPPIEIFIEIDINSTNRPEKLLSLFVID
jgi:hypothetical protein